MPVNVKYVHTNIVARDWRKLAQFYTEVFGCTPRPPERHLEGDWLDELTSLKNARIRGIHLGLPGYDGSGPTLEIFEYSQVTELGPPRINAPGFAHMAFLVSDVEQMLSKVKHNGGSSVGRLVTADIDGVGRITVVYARDPEGNIVELQNRK
jgi:predicted enzyme related to lactoylglutathione lyase